MLKPYNYIVLLVLTLVLAIQSCKPKDRVAPSFPPEESLDLDLSYFNQTAQVSSNFEFAQQSVHKWADFINDSLDFYRDLVDIILDKNLEYQTDKTWLINFEQEINEINYTVNYFEIIDSDTIEVKLFLSYTKESPYTGEDSVSEVLVMDGKMTNYESGEWNINLIDTGFNNTIKFLEIDWALSENQNPVISFTNLLTGTDNGNRVLYNDLSDSDYTSYLELYHNADENYTRIQWNTSSNIGNVKDFNQYGDENLYCWDEFLSDIVCPEK